ncbi:deoxyribonuclease [Psittacid alphaherpesvirus 5]|nr:deoxyribonuclease [Psittacid alphaherpesvirus 5]
MNGTGSSSTNCSGIPLSVPGIFSKSFYDYLLELLDNGVHKDDMIRHGALQHRISYLSDLCDWLQKQGYFVGSLQVLFSTTPIHAAEVRKLLSISQIEKILLTFEAETRSQCSSDLWKILRRCLLTASKIRFIVGSESMSFSQKDFFETNESNVHSNPIVFGTTNESCARLLTVAYYIGWDYLSSIPKSDDYFDFHDCVTNEDELFTCGLLMDIQTGHIGASIDMLVCPRERETGRLMITGSDIALFEIKCRYKYKFSLATPNPLKSGYETLLKEPNEINLMKFLYSVKTPGIEYFDPNGVPSATEALVTCDPLWTHGVHKKRKCSLEIEKRHLTLNKNIRSTAFLFALPDLGAKEISLVEWSPGKKSISIPVFVNPRHQNFRQVFIQTYVISGYRTNSIRPHLVTFFGRDRYGGEIGERFRITDCIPGFTDDPPELRLTHAIPILLLITPINIDPFYYAHLASLGKDAFETIVNQVWDNVKHAAVSPERNSH